MAKFSYVLTVVLLLALGDTSRGKESSGGHCEKDGKCSTIEWISDRFSSFTGSAGETVSSLFSSGSDNAQYAYNRLSEVFFNTTENISPDKSYGEVITIWALGISIIVFCLAMDIVIWIISYRYIDAFSWIFTFNSAVLVLYKILGHERMLLVTVEVTKYFWRLLTFVGENPKFSAGFVAIVFVLRVWFSLRPWIAWVAKPSQLEMIENIEKRCKRIEEQCDRIEQYLKKKHKIKLN